MGHTLTLADALIVLREIFSFEIQGIHKKQKGQISFQKTPLLFVIQGFVLLNVWLLVCVCGSCSDKYVNIKTDQCSKGFFTHTTMHIQVRDIIRASLKIQEILAKVLKQKKETVGTDLGQIFQIIVK